MGSLYSTDKQNTEMIHVLGRMARGSLRMNQAQNTMQFRSYYLLVSETFHQLALNHRRRQDTSTKAREAASHRPTYVQSSVADVLEKLLSELGDEEAGGQSQGWC